MNEPDSGKQQEENPQPGLTARRGGIPLWLRGLILLAFFGWTFFTTLLPGLMDFIRLPLWVMTLVSGFKYLRAGGKERATLTDRRIEAVMWVVMLVVLYSSGQYKFRQMQSRMGPVLSALERYKADKGAYPESLGQLEPQYIETVPYCGLTPENKPYYFQSHDYRSANGSLGRSQFHLLCQRPVWLGHSRYSYDSQYGDWGESSNIK